MLVAPKSPQADFPHSRAILSRVFRSIYAGDAHPMLSTPKYVSACILADAYTHSSFFTRENRVTSTPSLRSCALLNNSRGPFNIRERYHAVEMAWQSGVGGGETPGPVVLYATQLLLSYLSFIMHLSHPWEKRARLGYGLSSPFSLPQSPCASLRNLTMS